MSVKPSKLCEEPAKVQHVVLAEGMCWYQLMLLIAFGCDTIKSSTCLV